MKSLEERMAALQAAQDARGDAQGVTQPAGPEEGRNYDAFDILGTMFGMGVTPEQRGMSAAMADSAANASSVGLTGTVNRALGNGDHSKARAEANPVSSMVGEGLGAILTGGALGSAVTKIPGVGRGAKALYSKGADTLSSALKTVGRAGVGAGYGAAENTGIEFGKGNVKDWQDARDTGTVGAIFGAGGSLVGDAAGAGYRAAMDRLDLPGSKTRGKALAADYLTEQGQPGTASTRAAQFHKPATSADEIKADLASRPQDKPIFMTGDDDLQDVVNYGGTEANMGTTTATKEGAPRKVLNYTRNIMEEAPLKHQALVDKYVKPLKNSAEAAELTTRKRAAAGAAYHEIFDGSAGTIPIRTNKASKKRFLDRINSHFSGAGGSTEHGVETSVKKEVTDFLDSEEKFFSPKSLQSFKNELDTKINMAVREGSASKGAIDALVKVKADVTNLMKTQIPGYKTISKVYAEASDLERAADTGGKMLRATKVTPKEFKAYYDSLDSMAEKEAFVDAVFSSVTEGANTNAQGVGKFLAGESSRSKKVRSLLPEGQYDEFVKDFSEAQDEVLRAEAAFEGVNRGRTLSPLNDPDSRNYMGLHVNARNPHMPISPQGNFMTRNIGPGAVKGSAQQEIMEYVSRTPQGAASILDDLIAAQAGQNSRSIAGAALGTAAAPNNEGSLLDNLPF